MNRRYRIGEVVKDMGLGQYTLKHYQKAGLIAPQIDPVTGYRFYTYIEYGKLIQIRNLRAMGMGVEDVANAMRSAPEQTLQLYREQVSANEAEMKRLARANDLLASRTKSLERYMLNKGSWLVEKQACPLYFIKHFDDDVIDTRAKNLTSQSSWSDVYEQADIAFVIRADQLSTLADARLEWGVLLYRDDEVPPSLASLIEPIDAKKVLVAFLEVDRMRMQETAVKPLRRIIAEANATPCGDAVAVVNDFTAGDEAILMATTVLAPIE